MTPPWLNDQTWVISDTHWGHHNIVRYCNRPSDHERRMEQAWTTLVRGDDHILHLGDVVWYRTDVPTTLSGNVHLIPGNHDHTKELRMFRKLGWEILTEPVMFGDVAFSHAPLMDGEWETNIHGHIHNQPWPGELPARNYINVSVEVMRYRPVRLWEILAGRAGERSTHRDMRLA